MQLQVPLAVDMPLTQEDIAALQGMVATQLGPIQTGLQALQESVGVQLNAVKQQLTTLTTEQERLAREHMKQAHEAEDKFARLREEMAGLGVSHRAGGQASGRSSPPCKQAKREEDETMHDASAPDANSHRGGVQPPRPAMRRGSSQSPLRGAGADSQTGANPMVLGIKGFDGPRPQTFLFRESRTGSSTQIWLALSVKVTFGTEPAARRRRLGQVPCAGEQGRLAPRAGQRQACEDAGWLGWASGGGRFEAALCREKLPGNVIANRGLVCVEIGVDDIVSIVAKVSFLAELTIQPGRPSIGLSDPDAFRQMLEEIGASHDG